jgi:FMN phosphatase YigB (HAD superfamily)
MEQETYRFIFDMDGTLYRFDGRDGSVFTESRFYKDVRAKVYEFFRIRLGLNQEASVLEYERIKTSYQGEVSLGVEKEYGINRYEYFRYTWDFDPGEYIVKDTDLAEKFEVLQGRIALLTAAPRVWAVNVLAYLDLTVAFGINVFTGEPDLRKPDPRVFSSIALELGADPRMVFSLGDQEETDILPAREAGMRTVRIGTGVDTVADYLAPDVIVAIELLRKEGFV